MHHLWAQALAPLYAEKDTVCKDCKTANDSTTTITSYEKAKFSMPVVYVQGRNLVVEKSASNSAMVSLISATGQVVTQKNSVANRVLFENLPAGKYIAVIHGNGFHFTSPVVVKSIK